MYTPHTIFVDAWNLVTQFLHQLLLNFFFPNISALEAFSNFSIPLPFLSLQGDIGATHPVAGSAYLGTGLLTLLSHLLSACTVKDRNILSIFFSKTESLSAVQAGV